MNFYCRIERSEKNTQKPISQLAPKDNKIEKKLKSCKTAITTFLIAIDPLITASRALFNCRLDVTSFFLLIPARKLFRPKIFFSSRLTRSSEKNHVNVRIPEKPTCRRHSPFVCTLQLRLGRWAFAIVTHNLNTRTISSLSNKNENYYAVRIKYLFSEIYQRGEKKTVKTLRRECGKRYKYSLCEIFFPSHLRHFDRWTITTGKKNQITSLYAKQIIRKLVVNG